MSYEHKHTLPTPDQACAKYPHGTRARYYLGKCKCFPCRLANSDYEAKRQASRRGPWRIVRLTYKTWTLEHRDEAARKPEPIFSTCPEARVERDRRNKRDKPKPPDQYVPATKARRHLQQLQRAGVGVKSIGPACGVAPSVLHRILHGMIKRTRRATEAKILATTVETAARGRAKIDGAATWALLDDLIARGFTKGWIASQILGKKTAALQIRRDVVSGANARAVRELHARLEGQYPPARSCRWKYTPPPAPEPTAKEKLAKALGTWDADEFSVRLERFRLDDRMAS